MWPVDFRPGFPLRLLSDIFSKPILQACSVCGSKMANAAGNQIFVVVRKGKQYPPSVCDVRIKYEQTVADLKAAASSKLGVPVDKLLLFWQSQELTPAYDGKTLLDLNLHTGYSLTGYDLTEEPDFWPAVVDTPEGRRIVPAQQA